MDVLEMHRSAGKEQASLFAQVTAASPRARTCQGTYRCSPQRHWPPPSLPRLVTRGRIVEFGMGGNALKRGTSLLPPCSRRRRGRGCGRGRKLNNSPVLPSYLVSKLPIQHRGHRGHHKFRAVRYTPGQQLSCPGPTRAAAPMLFWAPCNTSNQQPVSANQDV